MESHQAEQVHRPLVFDKMENLVREMQDPESGVPVRSQKLFLTSIPSAFMGYDLIEWLMERLGIEDSVEAVHMANLLCQYGYFFPVGDSKNLVVKDDSSLYRFQTPYYWASQNHSPDNIEYAIYLAKRSLRNKQKHALEDYEIEALNNMRKILQHKWDFVQMQADEQVRLAKERKKGDKIVTDSQERAYWRVYRPPPGYLNCLETAPIPSRTQSPRAKKKTVEDLQREAEFLQNCLVRTRLKVSQEVDNLIQNCETYVEYDPFITPVQPSNPWIGDDVNYWLLNSPLVEIPTDKRVRKWGLSMEHVVSDPTGLQEFTNYLRKEYSHENIRFWTAVNDLRHSAQSQIIRKVQHIFEEFLAPGAPCEINIDGKTMERVHQEMRNPSRFTFDSASEHVYTLLLKKDCYPRFVRSEHYKNLLATAIQPSQRRRFFNFGGQIKKKISTASAPNSLFQVNPQTMRRRGSDKSLTGSAHDLMGVIVRDTRVAHSHSQSNLTELECDIPYRGDMPRQSKSSSARWGSLDPPLKGHSSSTTFSETTSEKRDDDVCPWESFEIPTRVKKSEESQKKVSGQSNTSHGTTGSDVCPWEAAESPSSSKKHDNQKLSEAEATSETSEISEQLKKSSLQSNDSLLSKKISIDSAASGASIDVNVCPWENNDTATPARKYSTVVMESHQTVVDANVHPPESESAPEETVISECTEESKKVPEQVTSSNTNTGVCVPLETSAIPEEVVCEETQVSMETSKITKGTSSKEEHVGESKKLSIAEKSDTEKVTAKDDKKSDSPKVHKTSCSSKHRKRSSLKPMSSVGSVDSNPGPSKECGKSVKAESSTTKVDTSVKSGYQTEATIPAEGPSEPRPTISPKKTTAVVPNWEETPTANINEICPWEDEESCKVDTPFVKTYATLGYL